MIDPLGKMKQITLYAYDAQLHPGSIGADFESGKKNEAYTKRYESEDAENMMRDILAWVFEKEKVQ